MTEEETIKRLDRIIDVLETNQSWLRLLAIDGLKSTIETTFEDDWEFHLYDRLDGITSIDELVDDLPTSSSTAGRRLKKWNSLGIARQNSDGKYDKVTSLGNIGVEKPDLDE